MLHTWITGKPPEMTIRAIVALPFTIMSLTALPVSRANLKNVIKSLRLDRDQDQNIILKLNI